MKDSTVASLQNAKDSAAQTLGRTASDAERKKEEAQLKAHEVKEEAKSSWWSWIGWGSSKSKEAESMAAEKVAEGAEGAKKGADHVKAGAEKRMI